MPVYVYSGAAGANDGTSWTDAYTSIASTTGVAAGTEIWVASDHSELGSSNTTWNWSNGTPANPVKILSIDRSDDSLAAGAAIGTTSGNANLRIEGSIWCSGLDIRCHFVGTLGANSTSRQIFNNCTFTNILDNAAAAWGVGGSSLGPTFHCFRDCTFVQTAQSAWRPPGFAYGGWIEFHSCIFTPPASSPKLFECSHLNNRVILRDCDVSAFDTIMSLGKTGYFHMSRCKIKSAATVLSGTIPHPNGLLVMEGCDDGTITVPPVGPQFWQSYYGVTKADLTRYRTGGADDGENANEHSWEMVANANALELYNPLESPPIVRWVEAGAQTLTVYVASGVTLQDDEFWVEVSSPGEGGSPTAQGTFTSTRLAPRGTPANLDADAASTWNGSDVGTKQKIDVAITPAIAGPVTIRCYLAKPSTTVYVDPKIGVA